MLSAFLNRVPGRFGWFLEHNMCLWTVSAELTINGFLGRKWHLPAVKLWGVSTDVQ